MPRRRLGVVLLVPPPARTEIDGLRRACGSTSIGRIPPHLTLVPPVNVREEDLPLALERLRGAAADARPFRVDLGPPETFHPASPVVYLAVGGDEVGRVAELRRLVFAPPLERPLTYAFHPHVTLAEEVEVARIEAMLLALADYRAGVTFDRVHLLQERRRSDGVRVWDPIADVPFARPAVVGRGGIELVLETSAILPPAAREFEEAEWPAVTADRGIAEGQSLVVVARRRGRVIGVARGTSRGDLVVLDRLVVAAAHRRMGVGSRLLERFESEARDRGCALGSLEVDADDGAERFYVARGWRETARLPRHESGRDRLVLRRAL